MSFNLLLPEHPESRRQSHGSLISVRLAEVAAFGEGLPSWFDHGDVPASNPRRTCQLTADIKNAHRPRARMLAKSSARPRSRRTSAARAGPQPKPAANVVRLDIAATRRIVVSNVRYAPRPGIPRPWRN